MDHRTDRVLLILEDIARDQHGAFTTAQALAAGVSPDALARRRRRRAVEPLGHGVLALPHLLDDVTSLSAAVLRLPGAVASHRSAARLHRLDGIHVDVVEVTVPHGSGGRRGRFVHKSTDLVATDLTVVDGIPCTTATRTLVDLGAVLGPADLEHALESALRQRLTTIPELERRAAELARRGRSGPGQLRRLLARRPPGAPATESALETLLLQVLRRYGVELPVRQHEVRDRTGRLIGRVDFAYPATKTFIEVDGRRFHTDADSFHRDRSRQNDLIEEGWRPLRFTRRHLVTTPAAVARLCRQAARQGFAA